MPVSKSSADSVLRFTARGKQHFHAARARTFLRLTNNDDRSLSVLPGRLAERFFQLRRNWKVLDFSEQDWTIIEQLRSLSDIACGNIAAITVEYIVANKNRVLRIYNLQRRFSDAMLSGDVGLVEGWDDELNDIDRQSLFILRLRAALNASEHEALLSHLQSRENSEWMRRRFVYPLVYHAVNSPNEGFLDTFLSYMVPQETHHGVERRVIRHLLRDDYSFTEDLSFKAYVGLICHPFDAYDALVNHFEMELAANRSLSPTSRTLWKRLSAAFDDPRLRGLEQIESIATARYVDGTFENHLTSMTVGIAPEATRQNLAAFSSIRSTISDVGPSLTPEWDAMNRMRWSRYPTVDDFDFVTTFARTWHFIDTGRIFQALLVSIYMVPRDTTISERRDISRLLVLFGAVCPLLIGAPEGDTLLILTPEQEEKVAFALSERSNANDRTWFHSVHWRLRNERISGKIRSWLTVVRHNFPIDPKYLTGIRWSWIDDILPVCRITPFRENTAGPYVLLLRDTEEKRQDSTVLRTAIEVQAQNVSCEQFVSFLIKEYSEWSISFVRYFLTPENIMLLRLAPNMMAALSERIAALEACARTFQFGSLLTEEDLRREQKTLTSALMLLNVNSNQFEIPWDIFRRDAAVRQAENYTAYSAMRSGDKTTAISLDYKTIYPHRFTNGVVVQYETRGKYLAVAIIILGIVDTFMDHPSYGIEAILSTRFRHDTLRREYAATLSQIKESHIPGVMPQEQQQIIDVLTSVFLSTLDQWLSARVQTRRMGYETALFDLTPRPDEFTVLVDTTSDCETLTQIVDLVVDWLAKRLEAQLTDARQALLDDFLASATSALNHGLDGITQKGDVDPTIAVRLLSAVQSEVTRRTEELVDWFRTPPVDAQNSLRIAEIWSAVEGRFESFVTSGRLRAVLDAQTDAYREVAPEKVRFIFDLMSEVVQNVLKYGGTATARVRVGKYRARGLWGLTFSSAAVDGSVWTRPVDGHPYKSLSDSLFREGNSGLDKVAAIAATICGREVRIFAYRRSRAFHLQIPLGFQEA